METAQWLGDEDGMLELCLEAGSKPTLNDWFFSLGWLMKLGETRNNIEINEKNNDYQYDYIMNNQQYNNDSHKFICLLWISNNSIIWIS